MRWLISAATALLALVVVPGPAMAGGEPDPRLEPEWPTLLCASGAIERTAVTDVFAGVSLRLEGYLDCARSADEDAYYGFARYDAARGEVGVTDMLRYDTVAPSRFDHAMTLRFFNFSEIGVCLVVNRTTRIGCVTAKYDGQTVTVTPLPTDAPLVKRTVWVVNDTGHPWPVCGHCR